MNRKGVLVFGVLVGVVGCGSRTADSPDGGKQDGSNALLEGGVDRGMHDAWLRDMPPPRDMPLTPDMPPRDMPPVPDQAIPPDTLVTNDPCQGATTLAWSGGKATASGDLSLAQNDLAMTYPNGCNLKSTPGPDLFYAVSVTAKKAYKVDVSLTGISPGPMPPFPIVVYVFESCASPAGTCVAGTPSPGYGAASLAFTAKKTGTLLIGVDSYSTSTYGSTPFTLTVAEHVPAKNDTCAAAAALTLTGTPGKATATGDTSLAANDLSLTPPNKCNIGSTAGPDLFYSLQVTAGQGYKVTVSPTGSTPWSATVYVFESCADPGGTCLSGSVYGAGGSVASFSAKKNGTVTIAVDSSASYSSGPFSLAVEAFQAPKNDTCAGAQLLTLSGTPKKATATGDTSLGTNAESLPYPNGCNLKGGPGPELFYALKVEKGKGYTIQVATSTSPVPPGPVPVPPPMWMPVVYVFGSCKDAAGTCIAGSQSYSSTGATVSFIANSAKTVTIAVDSSSSSTYGSGSFTLTVEETSYKPICGSAKPLTFSAGVAKVQGDTGAATNDVSLAGSSCYASATTGGDLFYAVTLAAGKSYTVTLTPGGFDPVMFLFTDCKSPAGSCLLASDDKGFNATETLSITPGSKATYYIGVDSISSGGAFTLTVK